MTTTVFYSEKLIIDLEDRNPKTLYCKTLPPALGQGITFADNMPFASHRPVALSQLLVPLLNTPCLPFEKSFSGIMNINA